MKRAASGSMETQPERNTLEGIRHQLEHDGFANVPVMSAKEAEQFADELWTWLGGFGTGITRDDISSHASNNWPPNIHGLIQRFGVGHCKTVWEIRCLEKIRQTFAGLWNCKTEDLLVSFDGVNVGKPYPKDKSWEHLDQAKEGSEFRCWQGCVSLTDTDGGLKFYGGSHKVHSKYFRKQASGEIETGWHKLTDEDKKWYLKQDGVTEDFVASRAGYLTLWDSRTVHSGKRPTCGETRVCVYVCYTPWKWNCVPKNLEKELKKKVKLFEERRMTKHTPLPARVFSESFQHYGHPELLEKFKKQPTVENSEVTEVMRGLIGYTHLAKLKGVLYKGK